jgi:TonB family protein
MFGRFVASSLLLALTLTACGTPESGYRRRDFNDDVQNEVCRKYVTRAATPQFPKEAQQRRLGGYVVVAYELDATGKAKNIRAIEAHPAGIFDAAAIETIRASDFDVEAKAKECRSVIDFISR